MFLIFNKFKIFIKIKRGIDMNLNAKQLLEQFNEEEKDLTPEKYQEEVRRIINNDFEKVRKELWELTKKFKEQYPGYNTYQLPMADRDIGAMAEVAGILIDLLDGKKRGTGMEKKLRKALGYNN